MPPPPSAADLLTMVDRMERCIMQRGLHQCLFLLGDVDDVTALVLLGHTRQSVIRRMASEKAASALTRREREVVSLVCAGSGNADIATQLDMTERTVRAHVESAARKLSCRNRTQLAMKAEGILAFPPI
ncbi:LuxR C-terminal-related transcriptional regulator [Laribacter hongkongensis]|uniref:helix-turn-helix domain-containing protein n=1 Tax=Laribacter hongkongensis TaxID=168471 RepID=UPI001EFD9AA0|nr:LuxR C-terminal-related transcriptional regulator [Laribacter hongkongensis]MCG9124287.1 LuxR C-terminal-related transcriptional regulator [Laribacter hongkongensis]